MSTSFNLDRAEYYPINDYAAGYSVERAKRILSGAAYPKPVTINDAIEAYQCKLIVERHPYFFDEEDLARFRVAAKNLFAEACRLTSSLLDQERIESVFDAIELQYKSRFWGYLASSEMWKRIAETDLESLLVKHPECLRDVLEIPAMVKYFDGCLCRALLTAPQHSAEVIIREFGVKGTSQASIILPPSVSSKEIDSIMLAYLEGEEPNLNYVGVLTKWPDDSKSRYSPSADVAVLASRRKMELEARLSDLGISVSYTIGVSFSVEQKACKGVKIQNDSFIPVYGRDWLESYTDDATILNNFIYVFEFMDPKTGLLTLPAHKHENSTFIETFTTRAFDEYPTSMGFNHRQVRAQMVVQGYEELLEAEGTSLEHALDFAFNQYFESQLGVAGFSVSMPAGNMSWLDKCKAMGSEIERVLKAHWAYCEKGSIDDAYFRFMNISRFDSLPSLIEGKYVVPGESFEHWASLLFHDQSPLAFMKTGDSDEQEFYYHINNESVTRFDFYDVYSRLIDDLIVGGFIEESQDGFLEPTEKARLLKAIWDNGAIGLHRAGGRVKQLAGGLVEEGMAVYSSGLFSPDEAAYMNYTFNDVLFSNALGLRNKYSHASFSVRDPNAAGYQQDYFSFLLLLVLITLKINDDLSCGLGAGGIDDFVDWPWVDDSLM